MNTPLFRVILSAPLLCTISCVGCELPLPVAQGNLPELSPNDMCAWAASSDEPDSPAEASALVMARLACGVEPQPEPEQADVDEDCSYTVEVDENGDTNLFLDCPCESNADCDVDEECIEGECIPYPVVPPPPPPPPPPPEYSCDELPLGNGLVIDCYDLLSAENYCDNVFADPNNPNYQLVSDCGQCDSALFQAPPEASCLVGDDFGWPVPSLVAIQLSTVTLSGPLGNRLPEGAVISDASGSTGSFWLAFTIYENDTLGPALFDVDLQFNAEVTDSSVVFTSVGDDDPEPLRKTAKVFLDQLPTYGVAPSAATVTSRAMVLDDVDGEVVADVSIEHEEYVIHAEVSSDAASGDVTWLIHMLAWSSAWPDQPTTATLTLVRQSL